MHTLPFSTAHFDVTNENCDQLHSNNVHTMLHGKPSRYRQDDATELSLGSCFRYRSKL